MNQPTKLPEKCLTAMIALEPLPGAPLYAGDDEAIVAQALSDLEHYLEAGVDAVAIENSFDLPYIQAPLDPAALSLVDRICGKIRKRCSLPLGLQLLEAANEDALRIAANNDFQFIRAEGYVFAHVGGAGIIEGCAGQLLRLRKKLGAENIQVFADVKKKHCSHALTGDISIAEAARQTHFFLADGIIVTGPHTGARPEVGDLEAVAQATPLPVWIGSGMSSENVSTYFPLADGFIVGSTFRRDEDFRQKLDPVRLHAFMNAFNSLKNKPI